MNVLYLTNNADRASTTVSTQGWFQYLVPKGLEPVVVSPQTGEFSTWCDRFGVVTYRLDLPFPSKERPWRFIQSLWQLRRIVKRHSIELIHCNEQDVYPIGQYLARLCGLPAVVSIHFTMRRSFCEWAFGGSRKPQRIFFISRGNLEACRAGVTGLIPQEDWRLLYNGLDLQQFCPDEHRRLEFRQGHGLDAHVVIGTACAMRPRKQLEHLFEAAARIHNPPLRVVVAGGPVQGEESYAQKLVERGMAQLGNRLVLLGYLSELRGLYNGLDIFINTSQLEACSMSVIESLACGCPVLGYASSSVDEQILPMGGEIVEQDNIDALTEALHRWISSPLQLHANRWTARKQAEEMFDIQKLAEQLWVEYQSLLGKHS
jgi:glycosyltransferase involved in cell wall biosynthesis